VALCLWAVLTLSLAIASAPAAIAATSLGGGSALSELTEGQTTAPTQTTATTSATEATTNSKTVIILALVAAIALLIGIAFVIVRDARRVAPVTEAQLGEGGSARDSAAKLQRRRAKAKAARRHRKRNR
jgi:beta-lactamase regulating signal transducer with metallopeptidase domain